MSKATFKAEPEKGGFVRTSLATVSEKKVIKLGVWDIFELVVLLLGIILVMRYLLR